MRLERAKLIQKKLLDDTQPTIFWTVEKLFTVQEIHISQNDQIWTENEDLVLVEHRNSFRKQKPSLVLVQADVTSR